MKTKIDRLITDHAFIIAIVLSLLLFLFSNILQPAYETHDDTMMEYLVYGVGYEHGTSFLVFINRIIGYVIFGISKAVPIINSYFFMQLLICFISNVMISSVFLKKNGMCGLIPILLIFAADLECFYSVQFTKTASIAAVAGIISVLYYLKNRKKSAVIVGVILLLAGSMYRFESFGVVALLMLSIVVSEGVELFKNRKEQVKEYLLVGVLIVCSILIVNMIGNKLNCSTSDLKQYFEFNGIRSEVFDHDRDTDGAYQKALEGEADVTGSQVLMYNGLMFNDPDVFDIEKASSIAGLVHVDGPSISEAISTFFSFFLPNIFKVEPLMIVLAAAYLISILCSKKKESLIILLFSYFAVICYLICYGRYFVHRAEWSIMFTVLVSILYLFEPVEKIVRQGTIKLVFMTFVCVMTVAGIFVTCFIPVKDHLQSVSDRANRHKASVDLLNDHEGYRYMIHTLAVVTDDRRTVFSIPHTDALSDAFLMGDWNSNIPESEVGDSCQIEGNPWTSCVDSNDIRVVMPNSDNGEYCIKVMEYYIEEQYGLEVTHVLEDSNEYVLIYAIVSEDPVE
ncbi:hypothetical protein SAMN05216413_2042 [Ruminococcaceae bacterium KH2T8]|nr:hypothetical protein SAMN05216413_2042 [Ruminococcaceae bacterium KH2T8]